MLFISQNANSIKSVPLVMCYYFVCLRNQMSMHALYAYVSVYVKACMVNITTITTYVKTHYTLFHWYISVREGRG